MGTGFVWKNEKVWETDGGDGCTAMQIHRIVRLTVVKVVNVYILPQLYILHI